MCCGGSNNPINRIRSNRLAAMDAQYAKAAPVLLPKEGMVILAFLGRGHGTRSFYGASGTRYQFGGKNHMTGYVLDSDVETMLAMKEGGKALFVKAKLVAPKPVVKAVAPKAPVAPAVVTDKAPVVDEKKPHDPPTLGEVYAMCAEAGIAPGDLPFGETIPKLSQVKRAITMAKKKKAANA